MSDQPIPGQALSTDEPIDKNDPHFAEILDKIKHPPSINETLMAQSKDELTNNPTVVHEMINESGDLRGDLKRDE